MHRDMGNSPYTGSVLGISEGVLLTSGRITETIGPNDVENKSFQQGTNGNALLDVVTGRNTKDACLFEFDIIPSGDSLRFNFVLGSEEYNEWVGRSTTTYSDSSSVDRVLWVIPGSATTTTSL
ncbi:MAG: choice-of-anchor L domain-containing protein [Flavobacteriales bacterium]|nr:choice-of-anchor L domain-containing protein [Flavobacteriales bacterium]